MIRVIFDVNDLVKEEPKQEPVASEVKVQA
jgi:diphthamide biosynthesis protein 3